MAELYDGSYEDISLSVKGEIKTKALSMMWSFIKKSQKEASYNFKSSKIIKMGLLKNDQLTRMYDTSKNLLSLSSHVSECVLFSCLTNKDDFVNIVYNGTPALRYANGIHGFALDVYSDILLEETYKVTRTCWMILFKCCLGDIGHLWNQQLVDIPLYTDIQSSIELPTKILVKEKLNFGVGRLHQCCPFGYIEFCQRENATSNSIPLIYHSLLPKSTSKMVVAEFGTLIHGYLNSNQRKYLEFIVHCAILKELLKSVKMHYSQLLGKIIFLDSIDQRVKIQESSEGYKCNNATFQERSHEGSEHGSTQPFILVEPLSTLEKSTEGSKETETTLLENISEERLNYCKVHEENRLNTVNNSQDVSEHSVDFNIVEIRQENNSFPQFVNNDSLGENGSSLMSSNFNASLPAATDCLSQENCDKTFNVKYQEQNISLVLPSQLLNETEAASSISSENQAQPQPSDPSNDCEAEEYRVFLQVIERDNLNAKTTESTEQLKEKESLTVDEPINCRGPRVYCSDPKEVHPEFLRSEEIVLNMDEHNLISGTSLGQNKDLVDRSVEDSSRIICVGFQSEEINVLNSKKSNETENLTEGKSVDMNGEKDKTNGSIPNSCKQTESSSCTEDDCGDSGINSTELELSELNSAITQGSHELSVANKSNDSNKGLLDNPGERFSFRDESLSPGRLVIDLNPSCHEFEKVVLSKGSCSNDFHESLLDQDCLQDFSSNQTTPVNLNAEIEKPFDSSDSPPVQKSTRTKNTFQYNKLKDNWSCSNAVIENCGLSFYNNLNTILGNEKKQESVNIVLEPILSTANVSLQTNKILNPKDDALVITKNSHHFKIHPSKMIKAKIAFKPIEANRERLKRKNSEKDTSKCKVLKKENIKATNVRSNPEMNNTKPSQADDSTTSTLDLFRVDDAQTRNTIKSDTNLKKYRIPKKKLKLDPNEILKVLLHESHVNNKHGHSKVKLKVNQMADDSCLQHTKGKFNSKKNAKKMKNRGAGSASHMFQDNAVEQFKRLVEFNSDHDITTELIKILQSHQTMTESVDRKKERYDVENLLSTITENCKSLEKEKPSLVNLAFQECDDEVVIHYGILKLMQRRLLDALAGIDCFLHNRNMFCILPKEFRLPEEENKLETFEGLCLVFRHDAVLGTKQLSLLRVLRNTIISLNGYCTKINELEKRNRALTILSSLHQIRFLVLEKLCCNNKVSATSVQHEISVRLLWNRYLAELLFKSQVEQNLDFLQAIQSQTQELMECGSYLKNKDFL